MISRRIAGPRPAPSGFPLVRVYAKMLAWQGQVEARVNGETANPVGALADRDVVLLVAKIRGGAR